MYYFLFLGVNKCKTATVWFSLLLSLSQNKDCNSLGGFDRQEHRAVCLGGAPFPRPICPRPQLQRALPSGPAPLLPEKRKKKAVLVLAVTPWKGEHGNSHKDHSIFIVYFQIEVSKEYMYPTEVPGVFWMICKTQVVIWSTLIDCTLSKILSWLHWCANISQFIRV